MGYNKRLAVCLLVGLVGAVTLQRIVYRAFWEFGNRYQPALVFGIAGMVLVILAARDTLVARLVKE